MARIMTAKSPHTGRTITSWAKEAFPHDFACLPKSNKVCIEQTEPSRALKDRRMRIGALEENGNHRPVYAFLIGHDAHEIGFEFRGLKSATRLYGSEIFEVEFDPPFGDVHEHLGDDFLHRLKTVCQYYFCSNRNIVSLDMTNTQSKIWHANFKAACSSIANAAEEEKKAEKARQAGREEVKKTAFHLQTTPFIEVDKEVHGGDTKPHSRATIEVGTSNRANPIVLEPPALFLKRQLEEDDEIQEIERPTKFTTLRKAIGMQHKQDPQAKHRPADSVLGERAGEDKSVNIENTVPEQNIESTETTIRNLQQEKDTLHLDNVTLKAELDQYKATNVALKIQVQQAMDFENDLRKRLDSSEHTTEKLEASAIRMSAEKDALEKENMELKNLKAGVLALASQCGKQGAE